MRARSQPGSLIQPDWLTRPSRCQSWLTIQSALFRKASHRLQQHCMLAAFGIRKALRSCACTTATAGCLSAFGRLSQENLRFGGTVDAATGLVDALTDAGRNAGLKPGEALPAATDALGGLYLVASVAGDQIAVLPGISFDAGDWCLCINEQEGWIRIDTLSGGGGGGDQAN